MKRYFVFLLIIFVCFVSCNNNSSTPVEDIIESPIFDADNIGRKNNTTDLNIERLDGRKMTRDTRSSSQKGIIGIFNETKITGKPATSGYRSETYIYTFKYDGSYNVGYSYTEWIGNGYDGASYTSYRRGTYNLYNCYGLFYIVLDNNASYRYLVSEKNLVLIHDKKFTPNNIHVGLSAFDYTNEDSIPNGYELYSTSYRGIIGAWVKLSDPVSYFKQSGEEDFYFPNDYLFEFSIDGNFHLVYIQQNIDNGIVKEKEETISGTYQIIDITNESRKIKIITEYGKEFITQYKVSPLSLYIEEPLENLFSYASITYISEFGEVPETFQVTLDTELQRTSFPILTDPKNDFLGWYLNGEKVNPPIIVSDDLVFEAKWESKCKVTFQTEYFSTPESFFVSKGTKFPAEYIPDIESFYDPDIALLGWYWKGEKIFFNDLLVEEDMDLIAKWVSNEEFFQLADQKNKAYRFSKKLEGIWILEGVDSTCRLEIKKQNQSNQDFEITIYHSNNQVYEKGILTFLEGTKIHTTIGYVQRIEPWGSSKFYKFYHGFSFRFDLDFNNRLYLQTNGYYRNYEYDLKSSLIKNAKALEDSNVSDSTNCFPSEYRSSRGPYYFEKIN